uniref:Methyltransferase FkbM domain-containing protein n=1 Tax=viral metagenome TaxID=1070528 RepID=A0A6C0E6T5_9ZZZZ
MGDFVGALMSSVDGLRLKTADLVSVPANTLTSILDRVAGIETIDLLSLDTEGYELDILKGLDLTRYRPRYMLIEVYPAEYNSLVEFLHQKNYVVVSNFSNYNYTQNLSWDGTHNDYLFADSLA